MTKPIDISTIENSTGKTWIDWLKFFDSIGAKNLLHKDIALKVSEHLAGSISSPGWWAQNVTVAYEQHIGRRMPGQSSDGSYEVSVTKTLDGTLDEAFGWWLDKVYGSNELAGVSFSNEPKISKTDKWRHWRVSLADGSKIVVSTMQKAPVKALLSVTSQKLSSSDEVEKLRSYWKQFLNT
jgi:hypothetical protein